MTLGKKHLAVLIPAELWDELHAIAAETRILKTKLVIEAVEDLVKKFKEMK